MSCKNTICHFLSEILIEISSFTVKNIQKCNRKVIDIIENKYNWKKIAKISKYILLNYKQVNRLWKTTLSMQINWKILNYLVYFETLCNKISCCKMRIVLLLVIITSWVNRILYAALAAFSLDNTEIKIKHLEQNPIIHKIRRKNTVKYTEQKWSFPLRISSVIMTKYTGNCGFGHIYWRNP